MPLLDVLARGVDNSEPMVRLVFLCRPITKHQLPNQIVAPQCLLVHHPHLYTRVPAIPYSQATTVSSPRARNYGYQRLHSLEIFRSRRNGERKCLLEYRMSCHLAQPSDLDDLWLVVLSNEYLYIGIYVEKYQHMNTHSTDTPPLLSGLTWLSGDDTAWQVLGLRHCHHQFLFSWYEPQTQVYLPTTLKYCFT